MIVGGGPLVLGPTKIKLHMPGMCDAPHTHTSILRCHLDSRPWADPDRSPISIVH